MELICSNCVYISSSSPLLSPAVSYSRRQRSSVKLNRRCSSKNRNRRPVVRVQKSDSLVEVEKLLGTSTNSALELLDMERGVCVPFRKYTPGAVRNKVLESRGAILSLVGRGVEIVWNLGFYWSALMYDCFVGRDEEVVPFRARQLRNLLCELGPSFIKAGQVLAYRPDIIREDYMSELCILQDDVPPFLNQNVGR